MSKIKVMSPNLANMIAAGEVIERPSSVIKELVENSIDAGSKYIQIYIENSGKSLIKVIDDGCGMSKEDALLAFKRHASSKLTSIYDLMKISTLGFRGEALPSIASIAHVKMQTNDGNESNQVISDPDSQISIKPISCAKGTCFEISELFFNTPARLKYLKSDKTETQSCIEVVQHFCIGFPNIAFIMYVDNNQVISTTGRGDLLEVISILYGNNIAKSCIPLSLNGDGYKVDGYVVHPSFSYSNKYNILTFLNNRCVYMAKTQKSIIDAYRDYLPPLRYPLAFLSFDIDYSLVDVNVHPTKKEVRLSIEDNLAKRIYQGVLTCLSTTRSTFNKVEIPQKNLDVSSFVREQKDLTSSDFSNQEFNENINQEIKNDKPINMDTSLFNLDNYEQTFKVSDSHGYIENRSEIPTPFTKKIIQQSSNFPTLVPVGQILQTYIVCDGDDGMYLIDQHAAAERINFEKCEDEFNQDISLQIPLIPMVIDLTPSSKANYDEYHIQLLNEIGIYTSLFGPNSIKVDQINSNLTGKNNDGIVNDIITQVLNDKSISLKDVKRLAIATKACKMSIKANHILTKETMVLLIDKLSKCRNPLNCPHGRPTIIKISKYDIEKLFKRTGF